MPRKPPQLYDVRSANSGALVVIGVNLATARSEQARLNAEARVIDPERGGQPAGMQRGALTVYEVTTKEGLIL